MHRALLSIFASGLLLSGCIIYETEHIRDQDCLGCEDSGLMGDDDDNTVQPIGDDDDDDDTNPDGTTDDPVLPLLSLTVTEGVPGEILLTWIDADADFDFTVIDNVTFVGPVTIVDTVITTDDAMLLLEVDHDATPGSVQVFVEFTDGDAVLLDTPFTVNEASEPTEPTNGDTGGCP